MSCFATPEELEKHHVRDVYDKIAPQFVGSRHKAWPRVEEFLLSLPAGSLIADVGCGTGKYLGLAPECFVVGSDSCTEFGAIAVRRGHHVVACDNQNLPFKDGCFDAVISVGVIHHFASAKRRTKALEELYRILRPGGRMLVYVWAFEQDERKFDGQDVLVPYTHYQRNKVLARRSMSTPARPRLQLQKQGRATPNMSAALWRSRRAYSCDDSRCGHMDKKRADSPNRVGLRTQIPATGLLHARDSSKYAVLQRLRKETGVSTYRQEYGVDCSETLKETSLKKLSKFFNSVFKKIFDDNESQKLTNGHAQGKAQANDVSMDTNTGDFGAKLSALMSYFSVENREKYFKGEFLSLLAKKVFPGKEDLHLHVNQASSDDEEGSKELKPEVEEDHLSGDVIICMRDEGGNAHDQFGERSGRSNGVNLNVMARLVDSALASLSDVESDSSSSGDYLSSDSSAPEEWDEVGTSLAAHGKKTFQHTTVNCQELAESIRFADSQYSSSSSSSSLFSTSTSSSSTSPSPSPSSSSSSPTATSKTQKKTMSKLFQRYYHVFRAGELVKLAQDGIPSAIVLKEYYDHGNWAVILEKAL